MRGSTKRKTQRQARRVNDSRGTSRPKVIRGSDNVFADLGFEAPEEELAKAKLIILIGERIKELGLTQGDAAIRMGISQPKVSKLLRGDTSDLACSTAWLMKALLNLGRDVEIRVSPANTATGHLYVFAC